MICKHVQDPIKAWGREKQKGHASAKILIPVAAIKEPTTIAAEKRIETRPTTQQIGSFPQRNSLQMSQGTLTKGQLLANGGRSISIFFCSAGVIAEKLANKLHRWVNSLVKDSPDLQLCSRSEPLNNLKASRLTAENILLLVVSSTGQGAIPSNGIGLLRLCETLLLRRLTNRTQGFRFAVFGNGDSRYSATYNGAAIKIHDQLTQVGGYPLTAEAFQADNAVEPLPLSSFKAWLNKLRPSIVDQPIGGFTMPFVNVPANGKHAAAFAKVTPIVDLGQKYEDYHRLLSTLGQASLVGTSSGMHVGKDRSLLMRFDVEDDHFAEMSCIQILPSNAQSKVNQALRSLCVKDSDRVDLGLDGENPTYSSFLTDYVDLELPFSDVKCLEAVELASLRGLTRASLYELSVQKVLERLQASMIQMSDGQRCEIIRKMCQCMPLLHTRTYSIASSQHCSSSCNRNNVSTGRGVDVMVKVLSGGRFSETFVKDSAIPASLRYRIIDSFSGAILRKNHLKPFIIVATGAGFGPVRSLLQWRIGIIRDALATGQPLPNLGSGISLFLGLKPLDLELIVDVLNEAMSVNLIDTLDIVPSNAMKHRVYDNLRRSPQHLREKLLKRKGMAFVCTTKAAAESTKSILENILGGRVGEMLGERYIEEVFW